MSVNQIESIVERLQHSATVRSVFGDPIERGDRTVVPVARVAFGFGGGYGSGGEEKSETSGQGGGGGGGASATPVGALEITDEDTRFVRFDERRRSLGLLVVGLVAGMLLGKRSAKEEH
ncbi:GerW family sporulation protein [Halorussus ruber]|uniref:GerW family sporulation protein n=1 Tax=Halorussus ruber TaxID=1126238 RepID=UPI0010927FC6|nr:spore germination protein GerW family protein [Halorussus ruber]